MSLAIYVYVECEEAEEEDKGVQTCKQVEKAGKVESIWGKIRHRTHFDL